MARKMRQMAWKQKFYNKEDEDSIHIEKLVVDLETRGKKYKSWDDQNKFQKVLFRTAIKQKGTTMKQK